MILWTMRSCPGHQDEKHHASLFEEGSFGEMECWLFAKERKKASNMLVDVFFLLSRMQKERSRNL